VVDPIFTEPEQLMDRLRRNAAANPERFLAMRLKELGLWRRIRYLPYVPFTVRATHGATRWSRGVFDEEHGYHVKYPKELRRSQISQRFVGDQESWGDHLARVRGLRRRRRLRRAYKKAGLHDRPTLRQWIEKRIRRIPGVPSLVATLRRLRSRRT
jgi:hypothetical protein